MSFPTQMLSEIITRSVHRQRDLWNIADGISPAPNFGSRFGILRGRFEELAVLPPRGVFKCNDKWATVCRLIDTFNKRQTAKFFPAMCR